MATKRQSYHATLRALRKVFDLTYNEARKTWRVLGELLDRRPFAKDVSRHPRITVKAVNAVRVAEPPPEEPPTGETEEWEVTVKYGEVGEKREHITIRLIGPVGATKELVRRVFWRGINGGTLDYWHVAAIQWDRISKRDVSRVYEYDNMKHIATREFRQLVNHAQVRVELTDPT